MDLLVLLALAVAFIGWFISLIENKRISNQLSEKKVEVNRMGQRIEESQRALARSLDFSVEQAVEIRTLKRKNSDLRLRCMD